MPFFEDAPEIAAAALPAVSAPAIMRQRVVALQPSQLDALAAANEVTAAAPPTLYLNFFDDAEQSVALQDHEQLSDGAVAWHGKVLNNAFSSAVFIVHEGVVTANIRSPLGLYQIRPLAGGQHLVRQIDASQFARDINDGETIPTEAANEPQSTRVVAAATGPVQAYTADNGTVVDVLVAYAPNARIAAGGTQAIRDRIDLAIVEANQIYANSQINTRLRLAYTYETSYNTSGSQATDLDRLTYNYDGYMEEVHELRDTYGADLVSLWVEGGDYCGIAW
ncbi:MAG: hypothetical protein KDE19_15675, partial [Caldilineaceae bacterium]|nr:hypothetical protein [Caldilineaceae bacterium]